ncbi:MAG: hypothetical protein Q7T71_12490, partial [Herbiconiux sp.]|nr:hypothetical protein [Herbiconiux sp.]
LETHPFRVELAASLGAHVLDPFDEALDDLVREATGGWGVDASIETSGVAANPAVLARLSARRARMAIIAWGSDITLPPLVPLGLDLHGCWHWNHQVHGTEMIATIRSNRERLDTAITDRFDLERVSEAMDLQDTGRCGKVLLLPFGEAAL